MAEGRGWLEKIWTSRSKRDERRSVDHFAAYRWDGFALKHDCVKDISSTGVYILTRELWQPGTVVSLTLQREGPLQRSSERRIVVQAKVVRYGEDGAGLAFVLADDQESRQWDRLRDSLIEETKSDDLLSVVRLSEAMAFLSRICPDGSDEIEQLLRVRLSTHRVMNAVEIALKAQNLLAVEPATEGLRTEPRLVVRILEDGSCTDEGWLMHIWGGLLASSCTADGKDELSRVLIELFSQLTTFPVRILVVVCTRATKVLADSGLISAKPLTCKTEEIKTITGSRGLQVERDLERLSELGLVEKRSPNSPTLLPSDEILITPTALGLQLFARCNGQRGSLREFYVLDSMEHTTVANQ
jgi:hypothetical protein